MLNDITYIWNLKSNTNQCMCKKERDSHRKQTNGYQRGEGRGRGMQVRGVGLRDTCVCVCVCVYCRFSHVQLFATPRTAAHQPPLSMRFSKQDYCSGLPFPSSGFLPNPGIKPRSPTLQADALPSEPPGKPFH